MDDKVRLTSSNLKNLAKCPSYYSEFSSDAASEGQFLHKMCEDRDRDNEEMTQEQKLQVGKALDYVESFLPDGWQTEIKMKIPIINRNGIMDVFSKGAKHAVVMDYKFGITPEEDVPNNYQMRSYAYTLLYKYKELKSVDLHLVMPRQEMILQGVVKRSDMKQIEYDLKLIKRRCEQKEPEYNPGDVCKWCDRKPDCEACMSKAINCLKYIDNLPIPVETNPTKMVTVEDRNAAQHLAMLLPDWCTMIKKKNAELVLDGELELPDFKITKGGTAPKVIDILLFKEILEQEGISTKDFLTICSISMEKLRAMLANYAAQNEVNTDIFIDELLTHAEYEGALLAGHPYHYLRTIRGKKIKPQIKE